MIEMAEAQKKAFMEAAKSLERYPRRLFMARIVNSLGRGGAAFAERELGWNRQTIIKGQHELRTGLECYENSQARGRKKVEELLPNFIEDVKSIVDSQSQTDPTFETTRLYTRISAREVRERLIKDKGYTDEELPTVSVIGAKLNKLGYRLRSVKKSKAKKNSRN